MLHYLDDLDSKMESMRAHEERDGNSEGTWTGYNPSLGRSVLKTSRFLEKKPAPIAEAASVSSVSVEITTGGQTDSIHAQGSPENPAVITDIAGTTVTG